MEYFAEALNAYARTLNDMAAMLVGSRGILAKRYRSAHPLPENLGIKPSTRKVEPSPAVPIGATDLEMLNMDLQAVLGDFCVAFNKTMDESANER